MNWANKTLNITENHSNSSPLNSVGDIIFVVVLTLLGTTLFGVVVYIARQRIKRRRTTKNRALKYLDYSFSKNENSLKNKKDSIGVFNSNAHLKKPSLSERRINSMSNKITNTEENKKSKRRLTKVETMIKKIIHFDKDLDKNSTDSQNSINVHLKIIGASPFKFGNTDSNRNRLNNNCHKKNLDISSINNNYESKSQKLNIFSNYNSLTNSHYFRIFNKGKLNSNKNCKEKDPNLNSGLNSHQLSRIKLNMNTENKILNYNDNKKACNEEYSIDMDRSQDKSNVKMLNDDNFIKIITERNMSLEKMDSEKTQDISQKPKYEFKTESKFSKILRKEDKFPDEFGKLQNIKEICHETSDKENKFSDIILSKNRTSLIKLSFGENHNQDTKNTNKGVLSNLNSSKYSEFEEKILEISEECKANYFESIKSENNANNEMYLITKIIEDKEKLKIGKDSTTSEENKFSLTNEIKKHLFSDIKIKEAGKEFDDLAINNE